MIDWIYVDCPEHEDERVNTVRLVVMEFYREKNTKWRGLAITYGRMSKRRFIPIGEDEFLSLDSNSELARIHNGRRGGWNKLTVALLVRR